MTESSFPWGAVSYPDSFLDDMISGLFGREGANSGVLRGVANEYKASGATTPCVVQTGRAVVNGTWHSNTTNVSIVIPTPAAATRIDLIVLRKDFAARTVRITRIAGVEGGAAPTPVQNPGVTWDIPLWQLSVVITTGAITYTDVRVYALYASEKTFAVTVGGRLSVRAGIPVTTNPERLAKVLYYVPYRGSRVPTYTGGSITNSVFGNLELSLGGLKANTLYDIFVTFTRGAVQLESFPWANSSPGASVRSIPIAYVDGLAVKGDDMSRTYLGTIRTTDDGLTEDSPNRRFVWNYYNRVRRDMYAYVWYLPWWYWNTEAWRAASGDPTPGISRIDFVVGLQEGTLVHADLLAGVLQGPSNSESSSSVGIGLNSTTLDASTFRATMATLGWTSPNPLSVRMGLEAEYLGMPPAGYNFLQRLEFGTLLGLDQFYGWNTNAASALPRSILSGKLWA